MRQRAFLGVGSEPRDLIGRCLIPDRDNSMVAVIRWYAYAVSQLRVGPRTGRATGSVNPKTLDAVWYRQFSGASRLARGGKISLLESPIALILMGDWCGPKTTPIEKKTGARSQRSRITRVEKREQEKFPRECLCLLTCRLPSDPSIATTVDSSLR